MRQENERTEARTLRQSIRWLPADTETPISLYLKMAGKRDGILLESAEVDGRWGRYSILATDMLFYVSCEKGLLKLDIRDDDFQHLQKLEGRPFMDGFRELMNSLDIMPEEKRGDLPPITRALYGYLGYGMVSVFNPHLAKSIPLEESECALALPASVFVFDHLYNRLCQLSLKEPRPLAANLDEESEETNDMDWEQAQCTPSEGGYKDYVRNIRNLLYQGEAIQVVPSARFCVPFSGNAFNLYRKLRRYNASPYMFYMHFPQITLFGSSPEVMVRCTRDSLLLAPIAGTRKRGATETEDRRLAEELLADPKDRAEHVMLVDLGRNDLGRIARQGSVKLEKYMQVERFSHVMHMTSQVTAELAPVLEDGRNPDALDVLAATFPAGTVSGAPKFRAMQIIRQLEGRSRGPYAGCIGWLGLDKDSVNMDMGITIRSMWARHGQLCWQAGGGIVHDSDPDLEWQEIINKSAIMRQALQKEDANYVPSDR